MSQMIDLETAKTMLGCDDATLQNLIDGGSVRAQRQDGVFGRHKGPKW